jgi:hypothetical protein
MGLSEAKGENGGRLICIGYHSIQPWRCLRIGNVVIHCRGGMSGSSFAVAVVRRLLKTSVVEVDAVGLSKCEKPAHFFPPSPSLKWPLENRVGGDP